MFGKGGALSAWLKEFCQLVFIQTLQAFIYAIIIIVIMEIYSTSIEGSSDVTNYVTGLGLFSVAALFSVFKIEDLARKIFGFGSTKADHGSAVKSIAKTAFALQLGKRVLNNGKQMVGGAKNMLGANKDAKKAADRLERRKQALFKDTGITEETAGDTSSVTSTTSPRAEAQRRIDSQKRAEKIKLFEDAQKARRLAQTESDPVKKKALINEAKQKLAQSNAINDTLVESTSRASIGGNSNSSGSAKPGNYHQKMLDIKEQYESEIAAAKKKRKEGFRTMTRGAMETTGAVIGGTAGGILGLSGGDLDDGINGLMSGAGLGDAAGEFATNTVFGAKDMVEGAYKSTTKAVKDYSSSIKEQYEEERKNAVSQIKDMNNEAKKEVSRINKNAEKARADLEKEINLSAGQTAKAIAKSVGKGASKAYNSRHGGIKQLDAGLKDLEKHISNATKDIRLDNNVESID